jgi:hypothetical protein
MWMFGQVSQAEYDKLKRDGWDIIRQPSKLEVDKFCDPSFDGECEDFDHDEFFVLICCDYDISEVASTFIASKLDEERSLAAAMERAKEQELAAARDVVAEAAFANYDFHGGDDPIPEGATIEDANGWESGYSTSDGCDLRKEMVVFYLIPGEENTRKLTFVVLFKTNSTEIDDQYVNLH